MTGALSRMFTMNEKPADEFVPYIGHITDEIVLLEDGTHLGIIRLEGKPMGLMGAAERYAERRRRNTTMWSLADDNVTIVEHHVCHDRVTPFSLGEFRSAFSRELAESYIAGIEKGLKSREWFITVMVHPRLTESLMRRIFGGDPKKDEALVRQIEDAMRVLRGMLRHYAPKRLGVRVRDGAAGKRAYSEIGEAIRMVLYARWSPVPLTRDHMAGSIYTDRVICGMRGFEVMGGKSSYGVMLGFREYPEVVRPDIVDAILSSDRRMVMTNSFKFRPAGSATDRMALRQRRMSNAGDRSFSLREGLDEAIDAVSSGRTVMGDHQWSLAVHEDDFDELSSAVAEVKNLLSTTLSLSPEQMGCFPAYWSQVPGSPEAVKARHGDIKLVNFCSFSPMVGFPRGDQAPHWGRPAIRFISAGNTAIDYSPHARRVGHTVILGDTGMGKTTVIALFDIMLEQNLVPRNGLSIILDKDGSNELSVLARHGYYVRIVKGYDSGMAPAKAMLNTPAWITFMSEFILALIMADNHGHPPADQEEAIKYGVSMVADLPEEMRSLLAIRQFLDHGEGSTGSRLERWCQGGALGWAFDGAEDNIKLDRSVVGIDNTEILPDDMIVVRQPAAAYQFFRIREKVGRGIRAAVYVDEGASYLPDARFAANFDAFSRELRKGNGMLWFAAHQPGDLMKNAAGRTLVAHSPRKFLFGNPMASEDDYRTVLKCSDAEVDLVLTGLESMGEGTFLVKAAAGSFIAKAPIRDQAFIAVLSSDPLRSALWHEIGRELNTTDPDRIWPVYRTRYREAQA